MNNKIQKYRYNNNLHLPINLLKFNKGAYFSGIKYFNHLPECIQKKPNDHKCFTLTQKVP